MFTKKQNLVVNAENNEVTIFPQTINFKWFEEVSPFTAHNIWQLEKTACLQNSATYQLATLIPTFFFFTYINFSAIEICRNIVLFSQIKIQCIWKISSLWPKKLTKFFYPYISLISKNIQFFGTIKHNKS